jgi:hypothetical protein
MGKREYHKSCILATGMLYFKGKSPAQIEFKEK